MDFNKLLYEIIDIYTNKEMKRITQGMENSNYEVTFSDNFKIKMNKLYRKQFGGKRRFIPKWNDYRTSNNFA